MGGAVEIGNGAANASFPAIAGGASGVFRLDYADNRTGSWNTFYRSSTDGGLTWSAEADISDADTGATYKTAAGFASEYGDYGAIDITNTGQDRRGLGRGRELLERARRDLVQPPALRSVGGSFAPVAPRPCDHIQGGRITSPMHGEDGTVRRSQHVAEHQRGDDRIVERSQERDELGDEIDR